MGLPLARSGRTAESSRREGGGKDVFGEYGEMKQSTLSHTLTSAPVESAITEGELKPSPARITFEMS